MEIKLPELEYGHIISHTFPGLFLSFEIILTFTLFTPVNIINMILSIDYKIFNLLALLAMVYIFSTMLGIILDGIHHFIFEKWEDDGKSSDEIHEIYKYISSMEQLQIYKQTVDKDYWYYYECYANIALAMIPGIVLFPYWFYTLNVNLFFNISFCFIYLVIIIININQAVSSLDSVKAIEKALLINFKSII